MSLPVLVAVGIVLLFAAGCSSGPSTAGADRAPAGASGEPELETVRLYVEMVTTSDHTRFALREGGRVRFGTTTVLSRDCEAGVGGDGLFLLQDLERAEHGGQVRAEAFMELAVPAGDLLGFTITRGHIGSTTVRLYAVAGEEAQLLGAVTWEGINATEDNHATFAVPKSAEGAPPLGYDPGPLDDIFAEWASGVVDFDRAVDHLYWPDATHIFAWPGEAYEERNAAAMVREEQKAGPSPDVDYDLIEFSPPVRFPAVDGMPPRYVTISSYDGVPSGSDVLWFEERDGEWRIMDQFWKIGVDFFG